MIVIDEHLDLATNALMSTWSRRAERAGRLHWSQQHRPLMTASRPKEVGDLVNAHPLWITYA